MAEWTEEQSNETTAIYNQLKGTYKKEADKIYSGPQLLYPQAKDRLEKLIEEQKSKSGLEAKTNAAHSEMKPDRLTAPTRLEYGLGLAGVLIGLGLAASGLPPITPL